MILRFHSTQPKAVREALLALGPLDLAFLGLPDDYTACYKRFNFPTPAGRTTFVDVTVAAEYRSAWYGWSQHAACCGLIMRLPEIIEPTTQAEESE